MMADECDDAVDVERLEPSRYALLHAIDDDAVVVHLAQPPFGVVMGRRHDEDVLDALAVLGPDIEAVANHETPPFSSVFAQSSDCARSLIRWDDICMQITYRPGNSAA